MLFPLWLLVLTINSCTFLLGKFIGLLLQFDNIKSIVKAYDDGDGSALDIIQKQFLLKEPLARYVFPSDEQNILLSFGNRSFLK